MATWVSTEVAPRLGGAGDATGEATLVGRVLRGDAAAFDLLMRRYNRRLYRIVRSILRDDAEAEEVLQEAYVSAYLHLGEFAGRASLSTWLARIAIHAALKRLRLRRRFVPLPEPEPGAAPALAAAVADPEQEAARAELGRRLEAAVDRLPARYRAVVVMRDIEEMSTEEVAACLRVSRVNVKVRLHRGRALLRRELQPHLETVRGRVFEFPAPRCRRLAAAVCRRLGLPPELPA